METMIMLNQSKAETVLQNGDYECLLTKPILVLNGDTLNLQQIFIDSLSPNSDSFAVAENTEINMSFIYYEINATDSWATYKQNTAGAAGVDYELYVGYIHDTTSGGIHNCIGNVTFTLPAGSYTAARLAQYITEQCSKTVDLTGAGSLSTGNDFLVATDRFSTGAGIASLNNIDYTNQPNYAAIPEYGGDENAWGPVSENGTPYWLENGTGNHYSPDQDGHTPLGGNWVALAPGVDTTQQLYQMDDSNFTISPSSTSGGGSGLQIKVISFIGDRGEDSYPNGWLGPTNSSGDGTIIYQIVNAGEGYARGDTVTFTSDQFGYVTSFNQFGTTQYYADRCSAGATLILTVESILDSNSYLEFVKLAENPTAPTNAYRYNDSTPSWIGATEVDLEFDNVGNGNFSWNFLHTPYYNIVQDQPLQPAVKLLLANAKWYTLTVDSGVAFTDLQPASFWRDTLGFNLNNILVKDSTGNRITHDKAAQRVDSIESGVQRTEGYLGLNGFLTQTPSQGSTIARLLPTADQTIASTLTNAINANEFKTVIGSGYYIIQLVGIDNQMITSTKEVTLAMAVVSKQYENNSLVTGFGESSFTYTHVGQPITIGYIHVKIIDPDTGAVATIGANNSIFLRHLTPLPQPTKK